MPDGDSNAAVCAHERVVQPSRPIPDWTSAPCPDCGELCKYGKGGLRTVRENNAFAAAQRPEARLAAVEAERDRLREALTLITYIVYLGNATVGASAIEKARTIAQEALDA